MEFCRIIALDYGIKRVGMAVCDPMMIIASGLGTLPNDGNLIKKILEFIEKYNPVELVLGMPTNLNGEQGTQAKEVVAFSEKLKLSVSIPIIFWDERFTSKMAVDAMREVGLNKKKRAQKGRIDEISAILILQSYIEYKKNNITPVQNEI